MGIKKGDIVRQKVEVVTGKVASFSVDQESGDLQFLVEWEDTDGNIHSKYFKADEVDVLPPE